MADVRAVADEVLERRGVKEARAERLLVAVAVDVAVAEADAEFVSEGKLLGL